MSDHIAYLIYVAVFTYCYYVLNKKLSTAWIFLLYVLILAVAIYPLKLWFGYARSAYGEAVADHWLKIILMMFNSLIVFNWAYAVVNIIVNRQLQFHNTYNRQNITGFPRSVLDNASSIRSRGHFFFYIGGVVLIYIYIMKV